MMVKKIMKLMVESASEKYKDHNPEHISIAMKSIEKDADLSPLFFLIVLVFSCSVPFALPHINTAINPHFVLLGVLSLLFVLYFYAAEAFIAETIEKKSICPHCHKEFSYFFDREDSREDEPYKEDETAYTNCPFETAHTVSTYVKTHRFDVRKCLSCGQEDEENESESIKRIDKNFFCTCNSCGAVDTISSDEYRKNQPTYQKRQSHEQTYIEHGDTYQENWVSVKTIQPYEIRAVYTCSHCGKTADIHVSNKEEVLSCSDKEDFRRTRIRKGRR